MERNIYSKKDSMIIVPLSSGQNAQIKRKNVFTKKYLVIPQMFFLTDFHFTDFLTYIIFTPAIKVICKGWGVILHHSTIPVPTPWSINDSFYHFPFYWTSVLVKSPHTMWMHIQSNLCITATLGTLKLRPLLTGGRCSEVAGIIKIEIGTLKWWPL